MLAAGLDGIENGYELGDAVEENCYEMGPERRAELGIDSLPGSLREATDEAEASDLVRYRAHVTSWELEEYLPVL